MRQKQAVSVSQQHNTFSLLMTDLTVLYTGNMAHDFQTQHYCRWPTRKLCYRKDDRAMRPMYWRPENCPGSLTTPTATFLEFLMGFCSD